MIFPMEGAVNKALLFTLMKADAIFLVEMAYYCFQIGVFDKWTNKNFRTNQSWIDRFLPSITWRSFFIQKKVA